MKLLISINFALLAMIMAGLFFISRANYRNFNQSSKYWTTAIVCNIYGFLLFAVMFVVVKDFYESSFVFGTVANTLMFASLVYQTASIHAATQSITTFGKRGMAIAIFVFAVFWDGYRTHSTPNERILTFAVLAFFVLCVQLYKIRKVEGDSTQRKIIFYAVIGEIVFTCLRIFSVSDTSITIVSADQLPVLGIVSVWVQYGLKIIAYAALVGYWSESLAKKKVEAELEAQAFKTLSERQEKLIADLGRLNKAATAGVLAASIAHELSQPLQSILLNNDLARDEVDKPHPNLRLIHSTLQEHANNAHHMVEIIHTLRGVFTESGSVEQRVDLFQLVERLGLLINSQAHKKGVQVGFEKTGETLVNVKVSEMQQVLLNLIGNSFDALLGHHVTNPKVKVSLGSDKHWVTCSVEDNGPGIPAARQADIFKFLDTTKTTGMGVGLWLSKYIVERNGGHISVGDSDLGGAKFTISLPHPSENT